MAKRKRKRRRKARMATKTGVLSIVGDQSSLDDGTVLARCSDTSPLRAGTAFLTGLGLQSGDRIQVTGTDGTIGGVAVFCMTAAQRVAQLAALAEAVPARARKRKKAAKQDKKKPAAKKQPTKKAAQKATKKKGRRRS